jgi:hypothetical protein
VVKFEPEIVTFCIYGCSCTLCDAGWGRGHYQYWRMGPRVLEVGFTPSPPPAYPYLVGTHDAADEVPHPWSSVRNLRRALCRNPSEVKWLN